MCGDSVPVGAADLKGAIGQVDLEVATHVLLKVESLLGGLEGIVEPLQAVVRKQLLLGQVEIGLDNEMGLYYLCDFVFLDAARRVVGGSVFGNCGPVECLGRENACQPISLCLCAHEVVMLFCVARTRSTSASVSMSSYEDNCASVKGCFFALLAAAAAAAPPPGIFAIRCEGRPLMG